VIEDSVLLGHDAALLGDPDCSKNRSVSILKGLEFREEYLLFYAKPSIYYL
jgi:hypothetical protein